MSVLPDINQAVFSNSTKVINPYFPLPEGTINSYRADFVDPDSGEAEFERNDHFATFETREIDGISVVVVRDTAYNNGLLVEDTLDWYAQDDAGNVWYLGEIAINYRYNDSDEFIGTDFSGSWEHAVDMAAAGYIMKSMPTTGDAYFQEFYMGVAEDEGEVIATGLSVNGYDDVVKILDTSGLDPGVGAFKYYAPGVGQIFEEEILLAEPNNPELVVGLTGIRMTDISAAVDPADLAFAGDGSEMTITFLTEDANVNGAIGAYTFKTATGEIGEGRILFANTEDVAPGTTATMLVGPDESLGLFLVPDVEELGIDLETFLDGGLFFKNFATGNVADIYDGDPSTTYTPGPATIYDGLAPLVTDADGNLLPIRPYHSVGNRDGFNFLNQVAGENALASDAGNGIAGIAVVSFEDGLASTLDFDGDFNDAFVAVSSAPLSDGDLAAILENIGISRDVGTDEDDRLTGTNDDDQLIGLEGDDRLNGNGGDDIIEVGDGDDTARGGAGDDQISGEDGDDRMYGGQGDDEIDGGDGDDLLFGGAGDDEMDGGDGNDSLFGGAGYDTLLGGVGDDRMVARGGGARMSGGAGDDIMTGAYGAADCFVVDLIAFGNDVISRFENGTDRIEIATHTGVGELGDIGIAQQKTSVVLSFADGTIEIKNAKADTIDATDFAFV